MYLFFQTDIYIYDLTATHGTLRRVSGTSSAYGMASNKVILDSCKIDAINKT